MNSDKINNHIDLGFWISAGLVILPIILVMSHILTTITEL